VDSLVEIFRQSDQPLKSNRDFNGSAIYENYLSDLKDSNSYSIKRPSFTLPKLSKKHPAKVNSGNISYYFDYRSNIDTPFIDKNVMQHSLVGQMSTTFFGALPVDINFLFRRTNSSLFSSINDVRIDFNTGAYAQMIRDAYAKSVNNHAPNIKDSLLARLKAAQVSGLGKIIKRINDPDVQQRLVESNEILQVPAIAESIAGPEKADSVRRKAKEFIEMYASLKKKEKSYRSSLDSLQQLVSGSVAKANTIQRDLKSHINSPATTGDLMNRLTNEGVSTPRFIKHLMAIRRLSLGRSQLNYSELTARNLSVNGINFEYNSWFYFALAAGTVDYRFRDFILDKSNRKPQYMYLLRFGLGKIEKNNIILSVFRGQKQSYIQNNSNGSDRSALNIFGMSLETRYRINRNSYVVGEIAQSSTPGIDLYQNQKTSSFFSWKSKISKAYSVKLFSYFPRTRTRIEAMYRYNGAAFQSFDRFPGNSAREIWYIKGEQFFWKRQLKLTASLRNNDFSNPYLVVPYSNNSLSKSVQVSFRKKNWPVVSAGLMPFSQMTIVNGLVYENRFHTLNGVFFYQYKVGELLTSSTATYNRFFNTVADTSFLYFNAINLYVQQYFYFKRFTLSAGGSRSINSGFELNTLEESVQATILKNASVAAGLKISNYNRVDTKLGTWFRLGFNFGKGGTLQVNYENGLIPDSRGTLSRSQLCNVMLTKRF
jgi:hypothetical protein